MTAWELVAFVAAAAVGELLVLRGHRTADVPASIAVLGAVALLGVEPWYVALVGVAGWAAVVPIRWARRTPPRWRVAAHRGLTGGGLALLSALGIWAAPTWVVGRDAGHVHVVAIVLVTIGTVLAIPLLEAATGHLRAVTRHAFVDQLTATWTVAVAMASSAALAAVTHEVLGSGSLLLMLLPVLAVQAGVRRYGDIRRTYDQTVIAMSRMTELTGHVPEGHGVRVGELAAQVARELGLPEREVRLAERAGHLHEVGRISTDDPDHRAHELDIPAAGASILREAGNLDEVADVVSRHHDPYWGPGVRLDGAPPVAARIVRVVCEFDRWSTEVGAEGSVVLHGVDRLNPAEHDPRVVEALDRVLARELAPAR